MSGAQHRRQGLALMVCVPPVRREGTQSSASGKGESRRKLSGLQTVQSRDGIGLVDASRLKHLLHPARAISSAGKAPRLHLGISPVIDKAVFRHFGNKTIDPRFPFVFPTALAQLTTEVEGQLVSRRCVTTDIMKGQLAQIRAVEGFWRFETCHVECPAQIVP